MQLDIVDIKGKKVGQVEVADAVFAQEVQEGLLWEIVKAQRAAARSGTHNTKTRADVRGGGAKPYNQKGTGNARQGSLRSPQFVGGGKVFGPHPRSYELGVNKKVRKKALASALSLRAKEGKLFVVDSIGFDKPKTKSAVSVLSALGIGSALVVDSADNANLTLSFRNLGSSKHIAPAGLNVYDILNHTGLVIAKDVLKAVEARVTGETEEAKE